MHHHFVRAVLAALCLTTSWQALAAQDVAPAAAPADAADPAPAADPATLPTPGAPVRTGLTECATGAGGEAQAPTSAGTGATDEGTIVVTARHRSESAQSVPVAISVVGGEHIDSTGAFNVGRLQQLTPALQFYSSNPRNTSVNIRGFGAPLGLTNDGIDQGVGIYVDDVYYSRVASSTFDFLDVAQIEVLRGPQGTLYGKNTTAGAINITSRQPTFQPEGRAEVSLGNYGYVQLKAAVSGPVTDKLALRLAGSETKRQGTLYNITTGRARQQPQQYRHSRAGAVAADRYAGAEPGGRLEPPGRALLRHRLCRLRADAEGAQPAISGDRGGAGLRAAGRSDGPGQPADRPRRPTARQADDRRRLGPRPARPGARFDHLDHRLSVLELGSVERPRLHRAADHHQEPEPVQAMAVHAGAALQPPGRRAGFPGRQLLLLPAHRHRRPAGAGSGGDQVAALAEHGAHQSRTISTC